MCWRNYESVMKLKTKTNLSLDNFFNWIRPAEKKIMKIFHMKYEIMKFFRSHSPRSRKVHYLPIDWNFDKLFNDFLNRHVNDFFNGNLDFIGVWFRHMDKL